MPQAATPEQKLKKMLETPIPKLIFSLSAPTILSMLITSLYNMADTYFVGMIGSASATGAVGVALPLMAVIQAVGFMFGHGSGNNMSRALGSGHVEDAERMAATGLFSAMIIGGVITALGLAFLNPLVYILGSTDTIAPHAKSYGMYILIGAPFMVSALVLNNQLRFQGSAFYGMVGITSGAVINVLLDPLFIFALDMGVAGAALATVISQFISFWLLLAGTLRGGNIRIRPRCFTPTRHILLEIFRGGVPSLFRQGLNSVATICLNTAARAYGDPAIAAMSIVSRVMMFAVSAVIGFGQGFQPVCGFNYGAGRYDRVLKAFWFCVKLACGTLLLVAVVALIFAPRIVWLFLKENPTVTEIGALGLRLQCLFLPLFGFVVINNMMMQTMGMAFRASLLAVARQGLFFIPLVLILPRFFGLLGVQMSQGVSDVLTFLMAVPISISVLRELKRGKDSPPSPAPSPSAFDLPQREGQD